MNDSSSALNLKSHWTAHILKDYFFLLQKNSFKNVKWSSWWYQSYQSPSLTGLMTASELYPGLSAVLTFSSLIELLSDRQPIVLVMLCRRMPVTKRMLEIDFENKSMKRPQLRRLRTACNTTSGGWHPLCKSPSVGRPNTPSVTIKVIMQQ